MVSQPENSGCLERTSAVSPSYQLQDAETVASSQVPVVSQPENSGCLESTSAVSPSYQLQDA